MSYLLDTNVVSELRKGPRGDSGLTAWFDGVTPDELFVSVITIGELRRGVDSLARRDRQSAAILDRWLDQTVDSYAARVIVIDLAIAEEWGRMNVPTTLPAVDGLLAATAKVHGLTLVTRNMKHVVRTGVNCLNPFALPTPKLP